MEIGKTWIPILALLVFDLGQISVTFPIYTPWSLKWKKTVLEQ